MPLLKTVCLAHCSQLLVQEGFYFWVDHLASDSFVFEYYLAEFNIAIERDKGANCDSLTVFRIISLPPSINKAIRGTINSVINELRSFTKVVNSGQVNITCPFSGAVLFRISKDP